MDTAELTIEGLIHDLNNVFQTINEGAELLASDPQWRKLAATLQRSVERGQRIANSIVEHNRPNAELEDVVESAVQFARDYLEAVHKPNVEFSTQIEPEFRVPGDPGGWERVLSNLFLNAVEAGATQISIAAAGDDISISDNGPGISSELLPTIFQPHVSTKSLLAGMGLFVVQSIVEQNGGTVSAGNREDGGAVFRIHLERRDAEGRA